MAKLQNTEPKAKSFFPELEEEVLTFWDRAKIFEQSLLRQGSGGQAVKDYVFYDGPPFATGLPHHGHIVASLMKDVVPRYWTMNGYRVERKWGWDCHGLPIENIAEKELGFKQKKDILEYGVAKFNEFCRSKVLSYVDDWKVIIHRLGRWADMENDYKTMDLPFMESVWWVFKQLWDKGLIYESYRSIHICPRCETTESQQEVTEGYKEGIHDLSATAKFELVDDPSASSGQGSTYVLAWTTTPWTLIANTALAINSEIIYCKVKSQKSKVKIESKNSKVEEIYILAKDRLKEFNDFEIVEEFKGRDLVGKKYKPLFDYYSKDEKLINRDNGWKIYAGDFVTTEDGTGIVHIAPAFGEDDLNLGKKENLPFVQHLGMDGIIRPEAIDFSGLHVKPIEDVQATDKKIVDWLERNGKLFSAEQYVHNYPHCWRCETPLLNYVTTSWFVNVLALKPAMLENAKEINWSPEHIKAGRWGKWLEGARDWSISRQRFWASVMPLWKCSNKSKIKNQKSKLQCENVKVIGSVKELEDLSGQKISDIHKHIVDKVTFECDKCGGEMRRVPDVLDTWFDSGSMPYAQMHYPFENKEKFEANFPAKFIAEGTDQTRAWFYYLHVLATAVKDKPAFKNVIVNGIVLAEDGKKMSKRLKNYTDPTIILDRFGADAMRYYLLSSAVMMADDLNFSDKGVEEALRKNLMVLWNVYKFYETYAEANSPANGTPLRGGKIQETRNKQTQSENVLDKWILARLNQLTEEVTRQMEGYDLPRAVRPVSDFINDLSTWYLRRSRERFKSDDQADKQAALATTGFVLIELSKIMAPFMPFIAEQIWQKVSGNNFKDENKSVHLELWPKVELGIENKELRILEEMELARRIAEAGLAARDAAGIKIRQALPYYSTSLTKELSTESAGLIKDELNVLEIKFGKAELGTELTEELKLDGVRREIVRFVNNLRKNAGMTIQDRIEIYWTIAGADFSEPRVLQAFDRLGEQIKKETLAEAIKNEGNQAADQQKEVKVNGETVWLGVKKV